MSSNSNMCHSKVGFILYAECCSNSIQGSFPIFYSIMVFYKIGWPWVIFEKSFEKKRISNTKKKSCKKEIEKSSQHGQYGHHTGFQKTGKKKNQAIQDIKFFSQLRTFLGLVSMGITSPQWWRIWSNPKRIFNTRMHHVFGGVGD